MNDHDPDGLKALMQHHAIGYSVPPPVLVAAQAIIWGDREKTYGSPAFNLETIAEFWNIWLKRRHNVVVALMPEDVAHMMVLLKMARLLNDPTHRDSLIDGAGYLGLVDRINREIEEDDYGHSS